MPELYTFVTEGILDLVTVQSIGELLNEYKIDFRVQELKMYNEGRYYIISGYNWEEDCGYPPELTLIFDGCGVNCVYCNNNEYGIINGASYSRLTNTTAIV